MLIATNPAFAQIVPDNTLSVNSVVTPQGNIKLINGGTVAGSNLFHSFQEFSVLTGETASFNNSLNIQNILTRVTGNSASNINGLLKATGNANLFLINPNGIIFGRNATLDIGGSFVASTASSIKFPDGNEFSAINPQSTSLLSITVPLGLQFPGMPANIINRTANLQVLPEKTIALVGGNVTLENSQLTAPQGRIELGSVAGNSLVNLNSTANGWTLGYSGINNFGNIKLSQSTVSANSGNIQVQGDIQLSQSTVSANSGNIQVQGDRVTLTDGSRIVSDNSGSQNGGEIFVRAKDLTVTNGSRITVQALNQGNAGRINVQADAVEVSGASPDNQVFSTIAATSRGTGDSGSINITTNRLTARDGGDVSVTSFNSGNGGNLTVNASEFVELIGDRISSDNQNFSRSGLFAATEGTGNGGDITINTPNLQVRDGARVSVSTRGRGEGAKLGGQGGNLLVNAKVIELSGTGSNGRFASGLFALSGETRPTIPENAATGDGGDIRIETGQLIIQNGAQVSAGTAGSGQGGNITVQADVIDITGASILNRGFSTLAATSRGTGDSGNISIDTRQLRVSDGADVSVTAFGTGSSGELNVRASDLVELIGASAIPNSAIFSRSGLFAATEGTKDGGSITVNAPRLVIKDGARISVSTRGRGENGIPGGRGGNLIVNASDNIDLSGIGQVQLVRDGQIETSRFASGLFALSGEPRPNIGENEATGIGGNLEINTGLLSIRDGAEVSVSARGSGPAGNLQARANSIKLDNGSIIGLTVLGNGANINLQVQDSLQLRGNSQISTTAGESGNGGNITITADTLAILENSSISANAGRLGGNVQITTQGLFALGDAIAATSALGPQFDGIVTINTPDVTPSQGLVEVPVLAPENQVTQACAAEVGKDRSQFIITGRGGLPPSPTEPLSSEAVRVSATTERSPLPLNNYPRPATGWGVNSFGEVVLTANAANTQTFRLPTVDCHVR
ncbi:filamentous hemagglutinin N-terminal domain-containing protein [Hassallia byssoidea VB512170]|uniref:Filamentous hemagglutinin N-terminal domain-containing protein n=1 Tax=Hassallia byssoidea VB512170 TaxID=1304833 RepID=A0A846HAW6_9CYAN|nr:filamentous hemagglutinin N-terminal domain-containing protein [Hassalia byssoidea]NEU74476.1 filamentous hemagglutinin N-terminal domain-containing protein [Hassalia byssoidea VB512170]